MTSLVMGQIKLRSGDVPCPVTAPGQSQPRLPGHPWSSSSDVITPESWDVSNPDSSLAACSRSGKINPTNMLLSKTYRGFTGNLNSRLFAKTEAETAAGEANSGIPRGKSPWEKKEPEG